MIVNKKPITEIEQPTVTETTTESDNPMVGVYQAVMSILKDIKVDSNDPDSPPLFKTVKRNYGQLARIRRDKINEEYGWGFPMALVHMINVRWLVSTSRIGEGRADLRICYILNRLNNDLDDHQLEGEEIFQKINTALNNNKSKFPALTERLQLTYFDPVESFDKSLQQFWITYEVWFRDISSSRYKDYTERYVVVPPFTNHTDQLPESNPDNHPDHKDVSMEDVSGVTNIETT
jgi:hypothetical protein